LDSQPKTYLVPERQRTAPPPRSAFGWTVSIFKYKDRDIINKCGLDAYFFLRYLQTLLIIFVPLACVLLPILIPINYIGGRNTTSLTTGGSADDEGAPGGLDTLAWGNVSPSQTHRYWAHLLMAIVVVVWVCYVFFAELRVYIRVRQDYLTSAEHRLRASATTLLVNAIPDKWLTIEALEGLFDVFPGGIRNIWINRNYNPLLDKVKERESVVAKLESAETELIKKCKKAQLKMQKKEEKELSKRTGDKHMDTKEERARKAKIADAKAAEIAKGEGVTAGDIHQVHHTVGEAIDEERGRASFDEDQGGHKEENVLRKVPVIGGGLAAMGRGLGRGLGLVSKVGDTVQGTVKTVVKDVDNTVETTNGFVTIDDSPTQYRNKGLPPDPMMPEERTPGHPQNTLQPHLRTMPSPERPRHDRRHSDMSARRVSGVHDTNGAPAGDTLAKKDDNSQPKGFGEHRGIDAHQLDTLPYSFGQTGKDMPSNSWWKFWKAPSGGFPSPLPHGYEQDDYMSKNFGQMMMHTGHSTWKTIKEVFTGIPGPKHEYPSFVNPDYKEDQEGQALWERYIKRSARPNHRLPKWGLGPVLPWICPWVCEKVDTIYWCREELARLNTEIEFDQDHPEDYPRMNSAFIQFNHQVAAHMAAQSIAHHVPRHMAPRIVEVSPTDVIWENMSVKWWEHWLRTSIIIAIVAGMCVLWAIPISATTLLGNIPELIRQYPSLSFLKAAEPAIKPISGVIPALVIGILMILPPMIFYKLASLKGNQTGKLKELSVQNYYFAFLFIQIFLVVSVASGTFSTLGHIAEDVTSIPETLAQNLPKASNYFFSYMIIQALGTSAANLLQLSTLITWFLLPRLFDSTARQKWKRNMDLREIKWGSYFPTYTNFACIALIYSPVAPLIVVFAIITFTVLWIANRYSMLYVYKHTQDTGGLLYPRAINQTFTGLYVMELCLVGLFFLVRNESGNATCAPQAIIMIVVLALTALYQILLNKSFGPLLEHLPITLEDDAVLRDEAFERAQAKRLMGDSDEDANEADEVERYKSNVSRDDNIEMRRLHSSSNSNSNSNPDAHPNERGRADTDIEKRRFDPKSTAKQTARRGATWATRGAKAVGAVTFGDPDKLLKPSRRRRDVEAQKLMGEALFGGYNDEIEDLTPEERDTLVRAAFQHEALRARRPNVWLPRDDLGVSDEEIRRTQEFSGGKVWITNKGAALDSKCRVVYGRNPPDFSEVDLIVL
jgi:hypothetical protein